MNLNFGLLASHFLAAGASNVAQKRLIERKRSESQTNGKLLVTRM